MLRDLLPDLTERGTGRMEDETTPMPSPGMLEKHYSPRAPLTLYEGAPAAMITRMARDAKDAEAEGRRVGILAADDDPIDGIVVRAGPADRSAVVATRLYAALRELDAAGVDLILARSFPTKDGLGVALRDRLRRAAGRVVSVET
jgi:L-threonylcarbamoyladenylate synthase